MHLLAHSLNMILLSKVSEREDKVKQAHHVDANVKQGIDAQLSKLVSCLIKILRGNAVACLR